MYKLYKVFIQTGCRKQQTAGTTKTRSTPPQIASAYIEFICDEDSHREQFILRTVLYIYVHEQRRFASLQRKQRRTNVVAEEGNQNTNTNFTHFRIF